MKVKDTDILFVPGHSGAGEEHWQTRWRQKLSTARTVEWRPGRTSDAAGWSQRVADAVNDAQKAVVIVAHSLGVAAALQAVPQFRQRVAGAFLVAPQDLQAEGGDEQLRHSFAPYPRESLAFPSTLVASRNDPWCAFEVAEGLAKTWNSLFLDAGEAGHLDAEAGYGPWPEGTMVFAQFLSRLT